MLADGHKVIAHQSCRMVFASAGRTTVAKKQAPGSHTLPGASIPRRAQFF
jgi:hypothetical protein